MTIVRKQRGDRWYLYEQHSYREGKKVRTRSRYLGPADGYQIEPGEVQADKAMQEWVVGGGPEKLEQEKAEREAAKFDQDKFLSDTQGPKEGEGPSGEEPDAPDAPQS